MSGNIDIKAIAREVARIMDRGEIEFQHDDDAHRGSAKRATNNGVPGLVAAPAAAGSAGNPGEIAMEAGFIYICVAANTWQRAATVAW